MNSAMFPYTRNLKIPPVHNDVTFYANQGVAHQIQHKYINLKEKKRKLDIFSCIN